VKSEFHVSLVPLETLRKRREWGGIHHRALRGIIEGAVTGSFGYPDVPNGTIALNIEGNDYERSRA
jgi:hypothetical protein